MGSEVSETAPLRREASPGPSGDEDPRPRVLVVEDYAPMREFLVGTLRDGGYRVTEATSCDRMLVETACGARAAAPIDLLVADMSLDDGSSVVAVAALRARGFRGPVIFLAPFGCREDRAEARAVPDAFLLDRPFDGRQLVLLANALVPPRRVVPGAPLR